MRNSPSETNIDEVLQTHTIFTNVSKGQAAKKNELGEAFGTADEEEIVKLVLSLASKKKNTQTYVYVDPPKRRVAGQ